MRDIAMGYMGRFNEAFKLLRMVRVWVRVRDRVRVRVRVG